MTIGERCLLYAVMALVGMILAVRMAGQFIVGHSVEAWKRANRMEWKRRRHGRAK